MSLHENNFWNGKLKETEFKATYIATFLANRMAARYDKDCANGHQGQPYAHQPVEDANFCANEAWKTIENVMGAK